MTGTLCCLVGAALTLALGAGVASAAAPERGSTAFSVSVIEPALARFDAATSALCGCALDQDAGSVAFESCRTSYLETWETLEGEITRMSLTSEQLARFLSTSTIAVDCIEEPASYLASSTRPQPRVVPTVVPSATSRPVVSGAAPPKPAVAPSRRTPYRYRTVPISALARHLGKLVRVAVRGGDDVRDELIEIDGRGLVLRHSRNRGADPYAIALARVERVEVLDRWP